MVLTDIYAAGEDAIPGITLDALAQRVRQQIAIPVEAIPSLAAVAPALARIARAGDMVITLGAGSIATVAEPLLSLLAQRNGVADGVEA